MPNPMSKFNLESSFLPMKVSNFNREVTPESFLYLILSHTCPYDYDIGTGMNTFRLDLHCHVAIIKAKYHDENGEKYYVITEFRIEEVILT